VIFDKMQGRPTYFIAESHFSVRSCKNPSLKQRAGRSGRIAGKSGGDQGLQEGGIQGSRKHEVERTLPTKQSRHLTILLR
jgi:hypothetical protein